jgi:hypothetical protein
MSARVTVLDGDAAPDGTDTAPTSVDAPDDEAASAAGDGTAAEPTTDEQG